MKSLLIQDEFFGKARALRGEFDRRYRDPRAPSGERFVWDYWHVPERYTHLRTPAYDFFPRKLYEEFHNELVWWGRRTLGCHDISPTWLSCYVDGCEQRLHADLPHGPWAFVFSLTPWTTRKFSGGETLLLQDSILDYWRSAGSRRGLEEDGIFRAIPPRFNRLLVFDPRIPHGVRRVEGTHDPRLGRLVVHGWFVNPRPFIEGPLPTHILSAAVEELVFGFDRLFQEIGPVGGLLSVGFQVSNAGRVGQVKILSNSVRSTEGARAAETAVAAYVKREIPRLRFPKARAASRVTLPLIFAAEEA